MKPVILLMFCLLLANTTINAQTSFSEFPKLEQLYVHFDNVLKAPGRSCSFQMAKKADGCYAVVIPYDDKEPKTYLKIWDAATKSYLSPKMAPYVDYDLSGEYNRGHEGIKFKAVDFDFNYLYGYDNWTTDLIAFLEEKKSLSTTELEMMARVYSMEATDYIHPQTYGVKILKTQHLVASGYEKVAPERVAGFVELAEKSLACYYQIQKQDPNYRPLIIDGLNVKINNELMHFYLTMKLVKEEEIAQRFIDRVNYTTDEINVCKAMLDVCDRGSVLYTSGDNDSFPFWYIQDKLGFRKDVTIINTSLLQTFWYYDYIRHTSTLSFKTPVETYKKIVTEYYYVMTSELKPENPNFDNWYTTVMNNMDRLDKKSDEDIPEYLTSFENIHITYKNEEYVFSNRESYYSADQLLIIDAMASNPNTSVYMSSPIAFNNFEMKNQFAIRGGLYQFTGDKGSEYWDTESQKALAKMLKDPTLEYSSTSSTIEALLYSAWCTGVCFGEMREDPNIKADYAELKKRFNLNDVIKRNDLRFISSYKSLAEKMASEDYFILLKTYQSTALKTIRSVPDKLPISRQDLYTLYDILDIYVPDSFRYDRFDVEKPELYAEQREVLKELLEKLNTLTDLPDSEQNIAWSMDLIDTMKHKLQEIL